MADELDDDWDERRARHAPGPLLREPHSHHPRCVRREHRLLMPGRPGAARAACPGHDDLGGSSRLAEVLEAAVQHFEGVAGAPFGISRVLTPGRGTVASAAAIRRMMRRTMEPRTQTVSPRLLEVLAEGGRRQRAYSGRKRRDAPDRGPRRAWQGSSSRHAAARRPVHGREAVAQRLRRLGRGDALGQLTSSSPRSHSLPPRGQCRRKATTRAGPFRGCPSGDSPTARAANTVYVRATRRFARRPAATWRPVARTGYGVRAPRRAGSACWPWRRAATVGRARGPREHKTVGLSELLRAAQRAGFGCAARSMQFS